MGLLSSIFSRKEAATADAVEQARTRARRRLIGAVVLVGIGVLAFPMLFETQPRPVAVDVPIEIPRRDAVAPLTLPPAASAPRAAAAASAPRRDETITETRADAGRDVAPPAAPAASTPSIAAKQPVKREADARPAPADKAAAAKPADKTAPKPADKPAEKTAAAPKPPAEKPADKPADKEPAAVGSRMVVQVGAYADANAARDARQRLDKLGFKAHTQVITTSGGKRIRVRVGPFASRDEAEQAAGRIKSAGLPAAVMTP